MTLWSRNSTAVTMTTTGPPTRSLSPSGAKEKTPRRPRGPLPSADPPASGTAARTGPRPGSGSLIPTGTGTGTWRRTERGVAAPVVRYTQTTTSLAPRGARSRRTRGHARRHARRREALGPMGLCRPVLSARQVSEGLAAAWRTWTSNVQVLSRDSTR